MSCICESSIKQAIADFVAMSDKREHNTYICHLDSQSGKKLVLLATQWKYF